MHLEIIPWFRVLLLNSLGQVRRSSNATHSNEIVVAFTCFQIVISCLVFPPFAVIGPSYYLLLTMISKVLLLSPTWISKTFDVFI